MQYKNITEEIIESFRALWPFEVYYDQNAAQVEIGKDLKEIWAFPLVAGSNDMDSAIYAMEEHRKVIPVALSRCAEVIDGAFLAGYYAKKIKDDEYEHGLVIIPANRESREANSELLTSYCFQRDELYSKMLSEKYFKQIQTFMESYSSICKKYWIQDTRLINTSFVKRPDVKPEERWEFRAATSTWRTEVYPDFMRPISMIGDIYIDFMLCNHKLISLQAELDDDDSIWDFFEEEGIGSFYSMPSELLQKCRSGRPNGWFETTDFELSSRKDKDWVNQYDICVPSLKGGVIDEGYSIGWCGKIAFMGIALDKPLYVTPALLREIPEVADFEQTGYDNKAFWRNRDIEYRKRCGEHILVKVCDDLMTEADAKEKLIEAANVVLQSCKNPLKDVQKGINKFVARYLKGLARGTAGKVATEFLNSVNSAQLCADEQEALLKIISWAASSPL